MGSTISLTIDDDRADELITSVFQFLTNFEKRFSANNDQSDLMSISHQAGIAPVAVDPQLFELIALGVTHSLADDSFLNIAIGPLVQTWRIGFKDANRPTDAAIQAALALTDAKQILLDTKNQTVFLAKPGMKIDLGALAKGYAADLVADYLRQQQVQSALINLGGNIVTIGYNQQTHRLWQLGIQDPIKPRGNHIALLSSYNNSVVTSGIYERRLVCEDKSYHHIFDRLTGYPIETNIASLTIVSEKSVDGEIWTTRLFGHSIPYILATVEQLPHIEALIIDTNNQLYRTSGLTNQLIKLN